MTLDAAVARFCRVLRDHGFLIGVGEVADAVRSIATVDAADRDDVRAALRAVLTSNRDDTRAFDALFDDFWRADSSSRPAHLIPAPATLKRRPQPTRLPQISLETWMKVAPDSLETISARGYSANDATGDMKRFAWRASEIEDVVREAKRLVRELARRPGRRWKMARRGARLDLRRMMRKSTATGGELVQLAARKRRPRRRRIVALCDVSGSMDLYSQFLLQFLFALQNAGTRVETFVFATRLSRVSPHLRDGDWRSALRTLADEVRDWSGGTRIGDALTGVLAGWSDLIDRNTLAIVLSDGWDAGDPAVVERALDAIKRRGARVVWLNPLMGSADYRPETRAMRAALPFLDLFAPLHDVASLRALRLELVRLAYRRDYGVQQIPRFARDDGCLVG